MKIKKKISADKREALKQEGEHKILLWVVLIIFIVDLIVYIGVFPLLGDSIVSKAGEGSADITSVSKGIIIVLIDIVLFIPLYMVFSRRLTKRKQR